MPFAHRDLEALDDMGPDFDGPAGLVFHHASRPLGLERCGLSHQRVPAGTRFPYGHVHLEQEEVYVVLAGSGRMRLDDEVIDVAARHVVRVPPGTWRGYEAGADGLELLVFGAPSLGDDPRSDVRSERGWWGG